MYIGPVKSLRAITSTSFSSALTASSFPVNSPSGVAVRASPPGYDFAEGGDQKISASGEGGGIRLFAEGGGQKISLSGGEGRWLFGVSRIHIQCFPTLSGLATFNYSDPPAPKGTTA
jgi:hypothetical protein